MYVCMYVCERACTCVCFLNETQCQQDCLNCSIKYYCDEGSIANRCIILFTISSRVHAS